MRSRIFLTFLGFFLVSCSGLETKRHKSLLTSSSQNHFLDQGHFEASGRFR